MDLAYLYIYFVAECKGVPTVGYAFGQDFWGVSFVQRTYTDILLLSVREYQLL